jgi:hypothetical protein
MIIPDNFMDYQDGFKSRKYQWDWINSQDKLENSNNNSNN